MNNKVYDKGIASTGKRIYKLSLSLSLSHHTSLFKILGEKTINSNCISLQTNEHKKKDYWVACSLTNVTINQLLFIVCVVVNIRVALRGWQLGRRVHSIQRDRACFHPAHKAPPVVF
jgi:hypothetical protein